MRAATGEGQQQHAIAAQTQGALQYPSISTAVGLHTHLDIWRIVYPVNNELAQRARLAVGGHQRVRASIRLCPPLPV